MKLNFKRLKKCRLKKGLSLSNMMVELIVKEKLKKSTQTYSNWENGISGPDVNELGKMASYFDKPIQYFIKK